MTYMYTQQKGIICLSAAGIGLYILLLATQAVIRLLRMRRGHPTRQAGVETDLENIGSRADYSVDHKGSLAGPAHQPSQPCR